MSNKPQTLLEAIDMYIKQRQYSSISSTDLQFEEKLLKETFDDLSEQTLPVENTLDNSPTVDSHEKIDQFIIRAENKLRSYSNDKEVYRKVLVIFFHFLKNIYPDINKTIGVRPTHLT